LFALDFKRVANADVGEPEIQALLFSFMKKINILALSIIAAQCHLSQGERFWQSVQSYWFRQRLSLWESWTRSGL
jgi:hypothetical protein